LAYIPKGDTAGLGKASFRAAVTVSFVRIFNSPIQKAIQDLTTARMTAWAGGIWQTQASDPTFSPGNGHFTFPQTITITSATPGATIFYTTDGSTPTHSSSSITSGGTVVLNSAAVIKAFAALSGITDSNIVSSPYAANFNVWQPQDLITGLGSNVGVGNPNVLYESGPQILSANADGKIFKLWYMPGVQGLAYAESNDGKAWTTHPSNPVIPTSTFNGGFGRLFKNGSTYWVSLTGATSIAVFTSTDGVVWTLRNANALTATAAWENTKVWQLNVVDVVNGTWYGTYSGGDSGNYFTSWFEGVATSTDGINWTKGTNNPVMAFPASNYMWLKSGSKYYGWSQIATDYQNLDGYTPIGRVSASNPGGPFTLNSSPTYYSTIVNEFVGHTADNVDDPSVLQVAGTPTNGMYLYCTKTLNGAAGGIILAIAPNVTLAQLVAGYEGVRNVPFDLSDLNLNTQASDNFTRSNANPIGGNWTPTVAGNTSQIASNLVEPSAITNNNDSYWNGFTWDNDQWARVTVTTCAANSAVGVSLRQSTSGADTCYRFIWVGTLGTSGTFFIQKRIAGVLTNLQSGPLTLNVGDTIQGAVIGTNLWMYQNRRIVNTAPLTDSSITSGSGGFAVTAVTTVTNAQVSSFVGGNFQDAGLVPVPPVISTASDGPMIDTILPILKARIRVALAQKRK
jgi:Chitobiase/beta-hexosaminidase C-terminal domain